VTARSHRGTAASQWRSSGTTYNFPSSLLTPSGSNDDGITGGGLSLGVLILARISGLTATGIRWWAPAAAAGKQATPYLFDNTGTQLASGPAVTLASGWNSLPFTTPAALTSGSNYLPTTFLASGSEIYSAVGSAFTSAVTTTQFQIASGASGHYRYSATPGLNDTSGDTNTWFGVDIVATGP
jgi:hypothetical protein